MEILVSLRKKKWLERLSPHIDGIIVGLYFTSGYHLSMDDLKECREYCLRHSLKYYILIDHFISEDDKMLLYDYLDLISKLKPDGIYFHDFGVFDAAKTYGLTSKLIYDGKSVLCNSLDLAFLLGKGIDSAVISRELTLEEIRKIVSNHPGRVDLQIFGHLRMSYSRRKFLTNYFTQIGKNYDYFNNESLYLVEEKRDYKMPILEDGYGTMIYTDYVFEMFKEISELKSSVKRGIIDTMFIDDVNYISEVCKGYRQVNKDNCDYILSSLSNSYPDKYSSGYLYLKTNITKDE